MPLQWNTLLQSGYERYLDQDFDRSGQPLPAPMLTDEWLTGPERALRDSIERERRVHQLLVRHSLRGRLLRTEPTPDLPSRGGTVPLTGTQTDPAGQSSPPLVQPSLPPEQPPVPTGIPITDDPMDEPPPLVRRDEDSDSDEESDEDEEENRNPAVTTRSGRRVRPPNRMNLNDMKVKELNARKSKNAKDLRKKLSSQKVRAGVLNHQFISSVKWTQLKSCMLTGQLGQLIGNIHQYIDHDLDTVENLNPSIFAAKANSEDTPTYEEAMNGPFAQDLIKSMEVEYVGHSHESMGNS
jgi:hypothetical protein